MSTKQVTITVTQSIHQVDKNGKVKKSLTTYEVMKPVESLKQVATQNTWEDEAKEKRRLWNKQTEGVWRLMKHKRDVWDFGITEYFSQFPK